MSDILTHIFRNNAAWFLISRTFKLFSSIDNYALIFLLSGNTKRATVNINAPETGDTSKNIFLLLTDPAQWKQITRYQQNKIVQ